jgi:hypothetical protein
MAQRVVMGPHSVSLPHAFSLCLRQFWDGILLRVRYEKPRETADVPLTSLQRHRITVRCSAACRQGKCRWPVLQRTRLLA